MFTALDDKLHDQMKAKTAAAYNGRDIASLEPCVDDQVNAMLDLIRSKYASGPENRNRPLLELGSVTSYLTVDVITRTLFGKEFGYLRSDSDAYRFLDQSREYFPVLAYMLDVSWLRSVVFSKVFLKLFGPKITDQSGMGKMMG